MAELSDRLHAALGDNYRILRELGGGGMSRVFLAEEARLGRRVVIKVLPPDMAAGVNAERFEREHGRRLADQRRLDAPRILLQADDEKPHQSGECEGRQQKAPRQPHREPAGATAVVAASVARALRR